MNPLYNDRHINQPLSNLSIAYAQDAADFVARRVFPEVPVSFKSDKYYEFTLADFIRSQMRERAPATESAEGVYGLSQNSYDCGLFSLHKDVWDGDRANADSVFQLDAEATDFLTQQSLLKEETNWAAKYFVPNVWGTTITGVAAAPGAGQTLQWSDNASDPIKDVQAGCEAIQVKTGRKPNKIVFGQQVWNTLTRHPLIIDRIKGGATTAVPAQVQRQLVAQLFELEEVLVMSAIQNTAKEGQAVAASFIGGKRALLVHAAARPARQTPSAGYTFAWKGYLNNTMATAITKFRMDHLKSDRIEIEASYVQQITGVPLGYLWDAIIG